METYATVKDLLKRRYSQDFIVQTQKLSAPIYSMLRENMDARPSGAGLVFVLEIDGNEIGGAWRSPDDNTLPPTGSERVKQALVTPAKYYRVCAFSGLAEAVSQRAGEEAFASTVTYSLSQAVRRASADFEHAFLRSDGKGTLTTLSAVATAATTISVVDARIIRPGMSVEFLLAGVKEDGPVTVTSVDAAANTIVVSSAVTASNGASVFKTGEQLGDGTLRDITMYGLPALVSNTGTIYGVNRGAGNYTTLQSKLFDAGTLSLDDALLRKMRRRLLIETPMEATGGLALVSNYEQFDRYVEIALPFRRFNDMRLDLGANQAMTTFGDMPWVLSWAADPKRVYMINLAGFERGVIRPLSVDERVNMEWVNGSDAFAVLMKFYGNIIGRFMNQQAVAYNLEQPSNA
jgi:hypothetical protein